MNLKALSMKKAAASPALVPYEAASDEDPSGKQESKKKTSCCCISTKAGALTIGYAGLLYYGLYVAVLSYYSPTMKHAFEDLRREAHIQRDFHVENQDEYVGESQAYVVIADRLSPLIPILIAFVVALGAAQILMHLLFVIGTHWRKPALVLLYPCWEFFPLVCDVIAFLCIMISGFFYANLFGVFVWAFIIILKGYCIKCAYSHYAELHTELVREKIMKSRPYSIA